MTNQEIAQLLEFISEILAAQGADRFRIRAYQNAASSIDQLDEPLNKLFKEHQNLTKIPGIGKTLAEKLTELFTTGNIEAFQQYVQDIPAGAWALSPVYGIGGKHALQLALAFQLNNEDTAIAQLIQQAENHQIQKLEGFGEKSEQSLLESLLAYRKTTSRIPYQTAFTEANRVIDHLKQLPEVDPEKLSALGSLRRKEKTVGDIDIGIALTDITPVRQKLEQWESVKKILASGDQVIRLLLQDDTQVDLKIVPPEEWGSFLQHYTGSKNHNIKLRIWALAQGKSLSEHGIIDTTTKVQTKYHDETDFYHDLGLNWIPPEKRIGADEIDQAKL